jgi:hypothetical protein
MPSYQVTYQWDMSHSVPVLLTTVSGNLLDNPDTIATIIDQTYAYIDQHGEYQTVHLVYDITDTERRLPLEALMRSQQYSLKVQQITLVGARSRKDEMAVLIMGAAKRLPYDFAFAHTLEEAKACWRAAPTALH